MIRARLLHPVPAPLLPCSTDPFYYISLGNLGQLGTSASVVIQLRYILTEQNVSWKYEVRCRSCCEGAAGRLHSLVSIWLLLPAGTARMVCHDHHCTTGDP
jgi:hypothetical protein